MTPKKKNDFSVLFNHLIEESDSILYFSIDKNLTVLKSNASFKGIDFDLNDNYLEQLLTLNADDIPLIPGEDIYQVDITLDEVLPRRLNGFKVLYDGYSDVFLMIMKSKSDEKVAQIDAINLEFSNLTRELSKKNKRLNDKNTQILDMAFKDHLTGLFNRRYLYQEFKKLTEGYKNGLVDSLTLVIFDIDHFKRINDTLGHDQGDEVLKHMAKLMEELTRQLDLCIRFGGDEFIILFVDTKIKVIIDRLNMLNQAFKSLDIDKLNWTVSASFGLVEYCQGDSFESLVKKGDNALYLAKQTRGIIITSE